MNAIPLEFYESLPEEWKMIFTNSHQEYNKFNYSEGTAWFEFTYNDNVTFRFKNKSEFIERHNKMNKRNN